MFKKLKILIILLSILKVILCEQCTLHITIQNRIKCLNINSLSEIISEFDVATWMQLSVVNTNPDSLFTLDYNGIDVSAMEYLDLSRVGRLQLGALGFEEFINLNVLNISNTQQSDMNMRIAKNSYIEFFDYSRNFFVDLKREYLSNLTRAKVGNFSYNSIETVEPTTFVDIKRLENLILENNLIKQIDFVKIPSLKHLNLRKNLVNELPANTFKLSPLLETLNLAKNTIQAIRPDSLNGLNNMKFFNISGNRLMSIESTAFIGFNRSKVSEIDLSDNLIASIAPGAFDSLRYVTLLKLDNNRLTKLSSDIFNGLRSLKKIFLNKNQLVEIAPTTFYNSPLLDAIDFSENLLKKFSGDIFGGFGRDDKIKRLLINNNRIATIAPNSFSTMYNLDFLRLDNNMLAMLDDYMFANCTLLRTLYLNNNFIEEIPINTFGIGQRLNFLYMEYNHLSFLPVYTTQLPSLVKLTIEGNPWQCPCLQDILTWAKDNVDNFRFDDYRGKKPVCVVTLTEKNLCHRNLTIVKQNRIVDIFSAGISS